MINRSVIVRLPPSPTGYLHVGNVRTLLFNYLFAKGCGGKIILRSEDTDKERSKREYEDYLKEALSWLGITWDEFYRQSERLEVYKEFLQRLINEDKAYWSEEIPSDEQLALAEKEGKELRLKVIRFRNPGRPVTFTDQVLGEITTDTSDLGDFVIAKDMETPLYHLTVVVDDHVMGVTHVIRGNDHIANTPRQILIQEGIGAQRPVYIHLPLIVGNDGQKLSKRHGTTATLDYRDKMGILPEAMANFLAFLGWNPGGEKEIFTMSELIEVFSLDRLQKSKAVFNEDKLCWINKEHLKKLSDREFIQQAGSFLGYLQDKDISHIAPLMRERISTFGEMRQYIEAGEYDYFFTEPTLDPKALVWHQDTIEGSRAHLAKIIKLLHPLGDFTAGTVKDALWGYAEEMGKGNVLWPMRYALSGRDKSPDPLTLANILGKEKTLERLQAALSILQE